MTLGGLTASEWQLLHGVLRRHPEIEAAILFGSRAKGTERPWSDLDLALVGIGDDLTAAAIAAELDELPLPYRYDVKAYDALSYPPLREHIGRVGIEVYRRGRATPDGDAGF